MTVFMVVYCIIMAILSALGIWKANKFGVTMLWLLLALATISTK